MSYCFCYHICDKNRYLNYPCNPGICGTIVLSFFFNKIFVEVKYPQTYPLSWVEKHRKIGTDQAHWFILSVIPTVWQSITSRRDTTDRSALPATWLWLFNSFVSLWDIDTFHAIPSLELGIFHLSKLFLTAIYLEKDKKISDRNKGTTANWIKS